MQQQHGCLFKVFMLLGMASAADALLCSVQGTIIQALNDSKLGSCD
jgi:hypothetical protein